MTTPPRGPYGVAEHSGPFAIVPAALIFDKRISAEAVRVYAALASHARHDRTCEPRQGGLAAALGVKQSTVSKHIAELAEGRYLQIARHKRNHYKLNFAGPKRRGAPHNIPPRNIVGAAKIPPRNIPPENIPPVHHTEQTSLRTKHGGGGSSVSVMVQTERTEEAQAPAPSSTPSINQWLATLPYTQRVHYGQHYSEAVRKYREVCAANGWKERR